MKIINKKVNLEKFFYDLRAKEALLILDYDGTLAPFSQNPEKAYPFEGISDRIRSILDLQRTKLVILSGRDLRSLKLLIGIDTPPELWGSHGGERLKTTSLEPATVELDPNITETLRLASHYAQVLAPGLYCEIKPLSVAVHWRGRNKSIAKKQSQTVLEQWIKLIQEQKLEIHEFDGGVELRHKDVNKGEAVKTLLSECLKDTMIAYLGDDYTDEEGFEVLKDRALKILVRNEFRPTKADIHLIPPDEVLWFLDQWIDNQNKEFNG